MADFDKGARYLVKQDPVGFFAWLWRHGATPLVFVSWLDARRLALPVEEDRTCDTVAAFRLSDQVEPTHALIIDFKARSEAGASNQLLGYVVRLRSESPEGEFVPQHIGGAVINLSGPPRKRAITVKFPGMPECGWRFGILQRTLQRESAAATLADITAGRTTRWLLPWIPLMHGGAEPAIMEAWKAAVAAEPDEGARVNLAALALVFAELTDRVDVWKRALEGWNVRKSQVVEEWREEGRQEGRQEGRVEASREKLLALLESRFSSLPEDLIHRIQALGDVNQLDALFRQALRIVSLDQLFR